MSNRRMAGAGLMQRDGARGSDGDEAVLVEAQDDITTTEGLIISDVETGIALETVGS